MKKRSIFLPVLILTAALLLVGCGRKAVSGDAGIDAGNNSVPPEEPAVANGEYSSIDIGDLALRPDGEAGRLYENDGLRLLIPLEYDELLLTETPADDAYGILFSVSERASVEAAETAGLNYDGAGWLFSIGRVDEARMREMLCYTDLSGAEFLAKDGDACYYVLYTPTDVRYMREDDEAMRRDQDQWIMLTSWAGNKVRDSFLAENPGLLAVTRGSTELELHLARIEFLPGTIYTVSTTRFGPLTPSEAFDASPWLKKLTDGVRYERVETEEIPDGEYVVLTFPEEDLRFDFFLMDGKENYVREVAGGRYEILWRAVFADGDTLAAEVMQDWYDALAAEHTAG